MQLCSAQSTARPPLVAGIIALLGMLQLLVAEPASAQTTPGDVYARMQIVHRELDELRQYMGRPLDPRPEIDVRDAAPHEVYYQALVMQENANNLAFEHLRNRESPPDAVESNITPADVLDLVESTLDRLYAIKRNYGLDVVDAVVEIDSTKTPTDVFRSVVQANRQINLLFERPVEPRDVFKQVTKAIAYTSRLLEQYPQSNTMPQEPKFLPNKEPADVYRRLLNCMDILHAIAKNLDVQMLRIEASDQEIAATQPSDALHLASLVVAELAYLHSLVPDAEDPHPSFYVPRKFPSDVYQRAGVLELQLRELSNLVKRNPGMLKIGVATE